MLNLGKKLSSVLLCGSMAVTLLGNSGVHAADEIPEDIEDKSEEEVTAVDEHDDKVENDDEGNENTELDTVETSQDAVKNDGVPAQNPAEPSGSSFAVDVAKGLGTVALGTGIGIGADEGVRRFKRDSSGNESGGQAQTPIASKDGTKEVLESQVSELQKKLEGTKIGARELQKKLDGTKEVLESQVSELQKKLEESEKIYLGNLAYGALGTFGVIPMIRDIVSSWLGRDFDVESNAAITSMIIFHIIGLALLLWNGIKFYNKGGVYNAVKMAADGALPLVGLILQCFEMIYNEFKFKGFDKEQVITYLKTRSVDDIQGVLKATDKLNNDTIDLLIAKNGVLTGAMLNTILGKIDNYDGFVLNKIGFNNLKKALENNPAIDSNSILATEELNLY